ncbi:hypothetical protein QYF36_013966 [Acer negundo]|nr:hypothetical protein QYF36_013966 [Acer negundo]
MNSEILGSLATERDELCKELDEAKAVIKRLRAEYQIKEELSNSLKKSHNEQFLKFQEAKQLNAEQVQELNAKQLNSAKEKLSANRREKLHKLEGENRKLVSALDEAFGEKKDLQSEDNRSIQDQLKWKTEQFKHLEEAHKKLSSIRRELEVEVCTKFVAEKAFQKEEERLLKALNEKEQTVLVMSMEEDLISTRKLEIEEKNKVFAELYRELKAQKSCEEETEQAVEARVSVELHASAKKNANTTFSPMMTNIEVDADERSKIM